MLQLMSIKTDIRRMVPVVNDSSSFCLCRPRSSRTHQLRKVLQTSSDYFWGSYHTLWCLAEAKRFRKIWGWVIKGHFRAFIKEPLQDQVKPLTVERSPERHQAPHPIPQSICLYWTDHIRDPAVVNSTCMGSYRTLKGTLYIRFRLSWA